MSWISIIQNVTRYVSLSQSSDFGVLSPYTRMDNTLFRQHSKNGTKTVSGSTEKYWRLVNNPWCSLWCLWKRYHTRSNFRCNGLWKIAYTSPNKYEINVKHWAHFFDTMKSEKQKDGCSEAVIQFSFSHRLFEIFPLYFLRKADTFKEF